MKNKFINYILSISFIIITLISTIFYCAFDRQFYSKQHLDNNIANIVGIKYDELIDVNDHLLNYLLYIEDDLQIDVNIDGDIVSYFNNKELIHMQDVKELVRVFFIVDILLIIIFILLLVYQFIKNNIIGLIKAYNKSIIYSIVLFAIIISIIAIDFNYFWNTIHPIFFNNDLWMLNPLVDRLLMMYPLNFFFNIVTKIIIIFVIINCITYIVGKLIIKYRSNND